MIALVHQEYIACGKLRSPYDHGISGRAHDPQIRLSLQAYFTAREVQVSRSLHSNIQLDLVSHALAGGGFRAGLDLASQARQVEILGETQAVDEYSAIESGRLAGAHKVQISPENCPYRILVAYANILGLKSDVDLQLRAIPDHSSGGNLPTSCFASKLSDVHLVVADVEDSI